MREDSTPLNRFSRDTFPPTIHPILDRQTDRKILSSLSLSLLWCNSIQRLRAHTWRSNVTPSDDLIEERV